jgi:hypothetical protein
MKILQKDGRLLQIDGKFLDAENADCCCEPTDEKAYKFCECCFGQSCLWVAGRAFGPSQEPCRIIKTRTEPAGCYYRIDAETDRLEAVLARDENVLLSLDPTYLCAETTICSEASGECRPCPESCCVEAPRPYCVDREPPGQCCLLGSSYEMRYQSRYRRTYEQHLGCTSTTEGSCNAGWWLTSEITVEIDWVVRHYCFQPSEGHLRRVTKRRDLVWDGFRSPNPNTPCPIELVNPRYEEQILEQIDEDTVPIGKGAYPITGVVCNFRDFFEQPITNCYGYLYRKENQANLGCFSGLATGEEEYHRRYRIGGNCSENDTPCDTRDFETNRQSYTVRVLSFEDCPQGECEGTGGPPLPLPPAGGGLRSPIGTLPPFPTPSIGSRTGCSSCRQEKGL